MLAQTGQDCAEVVHLMVSSCPAWHRLLQPGSMPDHHQRDRQSSSQPACSLGAASWCRPLGHAPEGHISMGGRVESRPCRS